MKLIVRLMVVALAMLSWQLLGAGSAAAQQDGALATLWALAGAESAQRTADATVPYVISVDAIRADGDWAVIDVHSVPKSGAPRASSGAIVLAQKVGERWRLLWPDGAGSLTGSRDPGTSGRTAPTDYLAAVETVPETLLDPLVRQIARTAVVPAPAARGAAVAGDYRLPWPAGEAATVTQNYAAHGLGQIDFWYGSGLVVAAKAGDVVYINDSHHLHGCSSEYARYNNVVVVRNTADEYTLYLHVATGSVPAALRAEVAAHGSARVAQGEVIAREGNVGFTCGDDGVHLHLSTTGDFLTYANPDDLDEDGDGDRSELVESAWARTHQAVDFVEATYDQLAVWPFEQPIVSQNAYVVCPQNLISGVLVYAGQLCAGETQAFAAETQPLNLPELSWNDRIRSLVLAPGWSVRVYQHTDQLGASRCLEATQPDLTVVTFDGSALSLDQSVSSMQIFHGLACTPAPMMLQAASAPVILTVLGGEVTPLTHTVMAEGIANVRLDARTRTWDAGTAATDRATIDFFVPAGGEANWSDALALQPDAVAQWWAEGRTHVGLTTTLAGTDALQRPVAVPSTTVIQFDDCADGGEWNDSPDAATEMAIGAPRRGVICPAGDIDFYAFHGTTGDVVTVTVESAADGAWLDPQVALLSADGATVLATADDAPGTVDAIISATLPATGRYLVRIQPAGAPAFGPGDTYTVVVTTAGTGLRPCVALADAAEPDDDPGHARVAVTNGAVELHTLPTFADVDWLQIDVVGGLTYTATTGGKAAPPLLALYAPDAVTPTLESAPGATQLAWQPLQSGRYLLRVASATPEGAGCTARYSVTLASSDGEPPVLAAQIEGNPSLTAAQTITIVVAASDAGSGLEAVRLADDSSFALAGWQPYANRLPFTLAQGDGLKTIFAQVRDRAGNPSQVVSVTVSLDATPPAAQLTLATPEPVWQPEVRVLIDASTDATAMRVRVADDSWGGWEAVAASATVHLAERAGAQRIELEVRDAAGNLSAISSVTVAYLPARYHVPFVSR